jgi:NADPH2:quinone reductase
MTRCIVLRDGTPEPADLTPAALPADGLQVNVTLAGINYWEVMQKHGRVPLAEPGVPGTEGVGVVAEAGSDVRGLPPGTRVAWSRVVGSWAEQVTGPAAAFVPVPDGINDATAAGLLFQGGTAHYLATEAWPLGEGEVAVVTAAAGGVGLLLTQLLTARGATVVGVTSSAAKFTAITEAGAAFAVSYDDDLADRVRTVDPRGAAAVYDAVGGPVASDLLAALCTRGALVLYGNTSGSEAEISPADLVRGSYFLTRTAGKDYTRDPTEAAARARRLFDAASKGRLGVRTAGRWKLDDAAAALKAIESRQTAGKLLLEP